MPHYFFDIQDNEEDPSRIGTGIGPGVDASKQKLRLVEKHLREPEPNSENTPHQGPTDPTDSACHQVHHHREKDMN